MSKYSDKERKELRKKHFIKDYNTVNLMPYKFELRDYDDNKSVEVNSPYFDEVEVDGEYLDQFHVTHWPSFKEMFLAVEDFLAENYKKHGLTLDDITISTESHHLEGWEDGPFEEIRVSVNVPRSIEEIEAELDEKIENHRKWQERLAEEASKKESKEKKLLEELKAKYE